MFVDADTFEAPSADPWAERELAILSELAEAGVEIALALKARLVETVAAEPNPDNAQACADLSRAFDRVSRAARLSIFLRRRLLKDAPARATRAEPQESRSQRAERVRRIVKRAVRIKFRDEPFREILDRQVSERLHDTDITGDLAAQPIGALVARICKDLGFTPRWIDLSEEAWAQAEITERPCGSPFATWPDLPPEAPGPLDDDDLWPPDDGLGDDIEDGDEGEPDKPGGGDP